MNRTILIASTTAVAALGLTTWLVMGPDPDNRGDSRPGDDAARFSNRPASAVGDSRPSHRPPMPSGPARLSDRSSNPKDSGSKPDMGRLLSPSQRAQLEQARQQRPPVPESSTGTSSTKPTRSSKDRAIAKMREDVRTAIRTNPEGWIDTYASLNRDFARNNGNYYGRGIGGGVPGRNPQPSEPGGNPSPESPQPETPTPETPTPEIPEPEVEPIELPLPIDEAQRLAEEFRLKQQVSLDGPSQREDRFKPAEE